jgi:hypothetical protein
MPDNEAGPRPPRLHEARFGSREGDAALLVWTPIFCESGPAIIDPLNDNNGKESDDSPPWHFAPVRAGRPW